MSYGLHSVVKEKLGCHKEEPETVDSVDQTVYDPTIPENIDQSVELEYKFINKFK